LQALLNQSGVQKCNERQDDVSGISSIRTNWQLQQSCCLIQNTGVSVYSCRTKYTFAGALLETAMSRPCAVCGDSIRPGEEASNVASKERLKELDTAQNRCDTLCQKLQGSQHSGLKQYNVGVAKSRYIELLAKREALKLRLSKRTTALNTILSSTSLTCLACLTVREDVDARRVQTEALREEVHRLQTDVTSTAEAQQLSAIVMDGLRGALREHSEVEFCFAPPHAELSMSCRCSFQELSVLRMQNAVRVFTMIRIEANPPVRARKSHRENRKTEEITLNGCSSILSMPVPNSGSFSGKLYTVRAYGNTIVSQRNVRWSLQEYPSTQLAQRLLTLRTSSTRSPPR
jgi:uncharacterized protein YceK